MTRLDQPLAAQIGLDWADAHHDVSLCPPGSEAVERRRIPHTKREREQWLGKLPEATKAQTELLYEEHDALVALRAKAEKRMLAEAGQIQRRRGGSNDARATGRLLGFV